MPQFFVKSENIKEDVILIINPSDIKHIVNVLRLKAGDKLILAAPDDLVYEVQISKIKPDSIETTILEKCESERKLNINIILAQSVLKGPKQDILIQKATELGVRKIIPLTTRNTVVKMASEKDKAQKIQKWQKISCEAAKQCKRIDIPEICPVANLKELLKSDNWGIKIACVEREAKLSIKSFLSRNKHNSKKNILLIIGPEGGWSDDELKLFNENEIFPVSLGNLILRAETAAITAISDVIYEFELE